MRFQYSSKAVVLITLILGCSACGKQEQPVVRSAATTNTPTGVFVQLFEWRWQDIAAECESVLGPAGYEAVQVSPPMEHVQGPEWWTRYQPVSYKVESRGGTRLEFADMIERCANVGVGIYADALTNHMANVGSGTGVAGSSYGEYNYPVPYTFDDFHHCGRNGGNSIANYHDLWEVQNCELGTLADLDTANPSVQQKIASYLNDLLRLGVAGFRLDAAKHIPPDDLRDILQLVDEDTLIFQEVIDRGGEPIDAHDYLGNGLVTEFKFPVALVAAFGKSDLGGLSDFSTQPGWLPSDQAVVFVDNHDLQRGHAGAGEILNYKDGYRYDIAIAFMLAYPYGYPMVMSSYRFSDGDQGPPETSPLDEASGCGNAWVCEHRRSFVTNMIGFRKFAGDAKVVNWQVIGDNVLSFGRGDRAHMIINVGEQADSVSVLSDVPPGQYCDLMSGGPRDNGCTGSEISVSKDHQIEVSIDAMSVIAIQSGE